MNTTDKPADKVIEYVETLILAGKLRVDDRLPAERDLAQTLNVSRTAVREGIRLLETIGIVESRQGSGNYITRHFDKTLERVLTMMYALDNMSYAQVQEFRYAVERQALALAVHNDNAQLRRQMQKHLDGMLHGRTEEEQTENDRLLHFDLVQLSGNRLVIANYAALDRIIARHIRDVRLRIQSGSSGEFELLQGIHRQLVEAVLQGDLEMGKEALDRHFYFIEGDVET